MIVTPFLQGQYKNSIKNFFNRVCEEAEQHLVTQMIKDVLKDQKMDKKEQKIILKYLRKSKKEYKDRKRF